ncbi:MAG: hypothetical protein V3S70_07865 [Gammaproteobacteria bacterium]
MSTDAEKDFGLSTDGEESGRIDYRERNVLTAAIYTDERLEKEADIEVVDWSPPEIDASGGFNPYDTASMFKK